MIHPDDNEEVDRPPLGIGCAGWAILFASLAIALVLVLVLVVSIIDFYYHKTGRLPL